MLGEFFDIVLDNVPNGFPPMRKINPQMDLVLGTSFPKKKVHRMTPVESEELKRQVHELLQKGLIPESLGPCVVPIVLAQKEEWMMEDVHRFSCY